MEIYLVDFFLRYLEVLENNIQKRRKRMDELIGIGIVFTLGIIAGALLSIGNELQKIRESKEAKKNEC